MNDEQRDVNDLLKELKETKKLTTLLPNMDPELLPPELKEMHLTEEEINQFIIDKAATLIQESMVAMAQLKQSVVAGSTADDIKSYAELIKAVSLSIDTLNKLNLQNKKATSDKELKQMDLDHRGELEGAKNVTNNLLIASREDIIKTFMRDVIDVEDSDSEEDDQEELHRDLPGPNQTQEE